MTVYDGGGEIVASLGFEGQAPRHEGHGDRRRFEKEVIAVEEDLLAGLITADEFGKCCQDAARRFAGWRKR